MVSFCSFMGGISNGSQMKSMSLAMESGMRKAGRTALFVQNRWSGADHYASFRGSNLLCFLQQQQKKKKLVLLFSTWECHFPLCTGGGPLIRLQLLVNASVLWPFRKPYSGCLSSADLMSGIVTLWKDVFYCIVFCSKTCYLKCAHVFGCGGGTSWTES